MLYLAGKPLLNSRIDKFCLRKTILMIFPHRANVEGYLPKVYLSTEETMALRKLPYLVLWPEQYDAISRSNVSS